MSPDFSHHDLKGYVELFNLYSTSHLRYEKLIAKRYYKNNYTLNTAFTVNI